jgi:hypothetical protein
MPVGALQIAATRPCPTLYLSRNNGRRVMFPMGSHPVLAPHTADYEEEPDHVRTKDERQGRQGRVQGAPGRPHFQDIQDCCR